jgi:hypothetical protein
VHLICPECATASLEITAYLELPADASSDEIRLQLVRCANCAARGAAAYEESRRGSDSAWHHTLYEVDGVEFRRLASLIQGCPSPGRSDCECEAHVLLGAHDGASAWALAAVVRTPSLYGKPIRYVP